MNKKDAPDERLRDSETKAIPSDLLYNLTQMSPDALEKDIETFGQRINENFIGLYGYPMTLKCLIAYVHELANRQSKAYENSHTSSLNLSHDTPDGKEVIGTISWKSNFPFRYHAEAEDGKDLGFHNQVKDAKTIILRHAESKGIVLK